MDELTYENADVKELPFRLFYFTLRSAPALSLLANRPDSIITMTKAGDSRTQNELASPSFSLTHIHIVADIQLFAAVFFCSTKETLFGFNFQMCVIFSAIFGLVASNYRIILIAIFMIQRKKSAFAKCLRLSKTIHA